VAAEVGAGHPVAGVPQRRGEEAIRSSQVAHAGHEHHERALAGGVVADMSFRTLDEDQLLARFRLTPADAAGESDQPHTTTRATATPRKQSHA